MWFIYILLVIFIVATIALIVTHPSITGSGNKQMVDMPVDGKDEEEVEEEQVQKIIHRPVKELYKTAVSIEGKKVLLLQPFFLPHISYLKYNINAIKSLETFGQRHLSDKSITIYVGCCGWAINDELWMAYLNAWMDLQSSSRMIFFEPPKRLEHNYGLGRNWNTIIQMYEEHFNGKPDYLISNGCDGFVPDPSPMLFRDAIRFLETYNKEFGCLALDMMQGSSYHLSNASWQSETLIVNDTPYEESKVIFPPLGQGGVAGSFTVISGAVFAVLGGRFKERGVYSSDDALFHLRMNQAGYHHGILVNRFIGHPSAHTKSSPAFQQWKKDSLARSTQIGQSNMSEEELIEWSDKSIDIFKTWD